MRAERNPSSDRDTIARLFELLSMRSAQEMSFSEQHLALEAADAFFGAGAPEPSEEVDVDVGESTAVLRIPQNLRPSRAVVYFHGGGFCIGSPKSERGLTLRIADALGAPVLVSDYRLAPEFSFPAALHDAVAAVRWVASPQAERLLGEVSSVVVGGTSAGANLAVTSALSLRDSDDEMFAKISAIFCVTGWFDITNSSPSQRELAGRDPILGSQLTEAFANAYVPDGPRDDPLVSPVYADLTGLPPIRLDGAGEDSLRDDSRRLAQALEDASVDTTFVEWKSMPHMFPFFATMLKEGHSFIYDELPGWIQEVARWE
jgi:monoterpene epsilon-lactone hydrolase